METVAVKLGQAGACHNQKVEIRIGLFAQAGQCDVFEKAKAVFHPRGVIEIGALFLHGLEIDLKAAEGEIGKAA